jgi:hypothetical protein
MEEDAILPSRLGGMGRPRLGGWIGALNRCTGDAMAAVLRRYRKKDGPNHALRVQCPDCGQYVDMLEWNEFEEQRTCAGCKQGIRLSDFDEKSTYQGI